MPLILLDENLPTALWRSIPGHDVRSVAYMGWSGLRNGELIDAAEAAGFEILLTADRGIAYQQNLAGRRIALIVLGTNILPVIRANLPSLLAVIEGAAAGSYAAVSLPRLPNA
jgi:hypothetical protein